MLARDKVLYDGHAVAAVAATSAHIAEEALRLIEVEYEVLPPVMSGRGRDEARRADPAAEPAQQGRRARQADQRRDRICSSSAATSKQGFKQADFVVEREFKTAMVHQGYIEPHNAVGIYNADGHATIYCSTQGAFDVRSLSCAGAGHARVARSKSCRPRSAAASAARLTIYLEPLSLLLSKKTGHPVKMVMTRGEVLRATGPTSGLDHQCKMGATKDGKLIAARSLDGLRGGRVSRARRSAPAR